MFKQGLIVVAIVAGLPAISAGQYGGQSAPPAGSKPGAKQAATASADTPFFTKAAQAGKCEIDLATLAETKSQNADVKALAAKIKADHQQAAQELTSLAATKHVTLPSTVSSSQQSAEDRLAKLTGGAFDKAYVDQMVADHKKAIADFTSASKSKDAEVKGFAEKTLPALKDHLQHSEQLQGTLGKSTMKP